MKDNIDFDMSPFKSLNCSFRAPDGTLAKYIVQTFPQYQRSDLDIISVDGWTPALVGSKGITWISTGPLVMYPDIIIHHEKNEWAVAQKEDITDKMKEIEEKIVNSDAYQKVFSTSNI